MNDPISAAHAEWIRHGWVDAADGMAAVLELVRAHRLLMTCLEDALQPFALSFARYEILMLLSFSRRPGVSIGSLGKRLQIHPTSVTSAVVRLEDQGLVIRAPSQRDRRVVLVQLSAEGRRVAAEATSTLNSGVFEKLGLTANESMRLWSLLRSFRANSGDFDVVGDRALGKERSR